MEMIDVTDEGDAMLEECLTGRVVAVHRDDDMLLLTYHDGRRVALLVESVGLVMEDAAGC
jgi:hypothetical protein